MASEILTTSQCYDADKYAAAHGVPTLTLMENAGRAVADAIMAHYPQRRVVVLCGPGNNGGDGFVVARLLRDKDWDVHLALLGDVNKLKGDAAEMAKAWLGDAEPSPLGEITDGDLVVDALFGAGLSRPLEGEIAELAKKLNASPVPVVAVDVPSGVQGDTGKALDGV